MTREEIFNSFDYQAAKAGVEYTMQKHPVAIGGDNFADDIEQMNRNETFEDGAEFGYNFAVKKACDWLYAQDELIGISFEEDFFERFREAMALNR